jgi:hypothetical protein
VINISKLTVRSFDLDRLDIFWEIDSVFGPRNDEEKHEIFDYQFFVLRSGDSPEGPYEQLAGPLVDQYAIRDVSVSLLHKWRQYYYQIKVHHVPTGDEKIFGPAASGIPEPDLIAAAIYHEEDVLFREFIGRRCWLFPRRTFGPRCTCWDVNLQRKTRSNHAACFGTGFLGGYMSPVEVWIQIDPVGQHLKPTPLGQSQAIDTAGRMIYFPPVSVNDILVESENRRWKVVSATPTERLRTPVRWELGLHEIPKGDIEYDLPLNVNTQTLQPSAERNFLNRQNLENDGEDYDDIIAAFGHPRGAIR